MRTLVETAKSLTAQRDEASNNFNVFVQGLQSQGVSPEQYGETLTYLGLFNRAMSGDVKAGEEALQVIAEHAERLATFLGKDLNLGDPLAKHADLKDAVQKGQITLQHARELARHRNQGAFRGQITEQARQTQQTTQQQQQVLLKARGELTALESTLRSQDPNYEAKKAILVPMLQKVFPAVSPAEWPQRFRDAYQALPNSLLAPRRPAVPKNQPLRGGKQPAGGQTKAPGSMLDAINGALSGMK